MLDKGLKNACIMITRIVKINAEVMNGTISSHAIKDYGLVIVTKQLQRETLSSRKPRKKVFTHD